MNISFNGFNAKVMTFAAAENCTVGKAVTVSEDGEVIEPNVNEAFIGVCTSLRNGVAGVQVEGYVEHEYSGTAPKLGVSKLAYDTNGRITVSSEVTSPFYRVIKIDPDNKIVGFIL